ncbi:hypothetical protein TSUD_282540 [Trifolium subterraneum]|uniref:Uncharacterized protein n=1 Tax=Trifolium subterraneum TaxID=3900 RepID=A0A2Z6P3S3_TRISU|nr:hypothetical protein TSUD_282540 [Trifolium subterraneum]
MSNKAKNTLITLLTSSWKHFKNDFIRISPSLKSPLWYDDFGAPFFPFHWTKRPVMKPNLRSKGMLSNQERARIRRKVGEEDKGSQQDAHKD